MIHLLRTPSSTPAESWCGITNATRRLTDTLVADVKDVDCPTCRVYVAAVPAVGGRRTGKTHALREQLKRYLGEGKKVSKALDPDGRVTGYYVVGADGGTELVATDENINLDTLNEERRNEKPLIPWPLEGVVGGPPTDTCPNDNCNGMDIVWNGNTVPVADDPLTAPPIFNGKLKLTDMEAVVFAHCKTCLSTVWLGTFQQFVTDVLEKHYRFNQLLTPADFTEEKPDE